MQYLFSPLGYVGLFSNLLILYLFFLLSTGKKRPFFLMAFFCSSLCHQLVLQGQVISPLDMELYLLILIFIILTYPASIYGYVLAYSGKKLSFYWLHYLCWPALYAVGYTLKQWEILNIPNAFFSAVQILPLTIYLVLAYRDLAWKMLEKPEKKWMAAFMSIATAKTLMIVVEDIGLRINWQWFVPNVSFYFVFVSFINLTVFCLIMIRQMMIKPSIVRRAHYVGSQVSSVLPSEVEVLKKYVIDNKAYLNNELNRAEVSENTGLSINRVSEIVNSHFDQNFNQWVNELRLERSKQLLTETDRSIKEIYFETGFSSKSVFNASFKKYIGVTPTVFRRKNRLESINT